MLGTITGGLKKLSERRTLLNWLPYKFFNQMEEIAWKTVKDNLERCASFCLVPEGEEQLIITPETVGSRVEVPTPICPSGTKLVGDYHTHPSQSEIKFSCHDTISALIRRQSFACVGGFKTVDYPEEGFVVPEFRTKCHSFIQDHPELETLIFGLMEKCLNLDAAQAQAAKEIMALDKKDKIKIQEAMKRLKIAEKEWNDAYNEAILKGLIIRSSPGIRNEEDLVRRSIAERAQPHDAFKRYLESKGISIEEARKSPGMEQRRIKNFSDEVI